MLKTFLIPAAPVPKPIVADSRELIKPCGACLQRIAEFAAPETPVHLADSQNVRQTFKLSDLLPQAFNAEELSE